jgi:YihY family inner membrane protein
MREPLAKFFADRGTHLAAMIAYFALLSFIPLVFLTLALLGFSGRADASDFFVRELNSAFPSSSLATILKVVRAIQANAATLGILGGVFLAWSSLSLFSALESAFNIVYDRPNRGFLHGKAVASLLLVGSLVTLFAALVIGALGVEIVRDIAPGVLENYALAYAVSIAASLAGIFAFLAIVYSRLTNAPVTLREALPGAVGAAVVLEASFQVLPVFVKYASVNVTLRAFGGPVLLLIWLYVMANVIVLGAELNWWLAHRREAQAEEVAGFA